MISARAILISVRRSALDWQSDKGQGRNTCPAFIFD